MTLNDSTPGRRTAWTLAAVATAGALAGLLAGPLVAGAALVAGALLAAAHEIARSSRHAAGDSSATLEALESIARETRSVAERGESLATAASALEQLETRFASLERTWAEGQERSVGQTVGIVRDGLGELRSELKDVIEEAASASKLAVGQAVAPLLQDAGEAARDTVGQLIARLDHDASVRNERDEASAARVSEVLEQVLRHGREQVETLVETSRTRDEAATGQRVALERKLVEAEEARSERLQQWAGTLQTELSTTLTQLAERIDERGADWARELEAQREHLREASELIHAGGAELSATAEAFGAALDRHQDGARQWLESLGDLEASLDAAGEQAAARALDARLGETQELFARQLAFQRELFEQLRALREPVNEPASTASEPESASLG